MTAATVRTVPASTDLRWAVRAVVALVPHPLLWTTAVRQALVLAAPGWWRRPPFLPLPAPGYLRFRLETIYGGTGEQPIEPSDLLEYLRWCREFPRRTQ
jgi:hypothetical protein